MNGWLGWDWCAVKAVGLFHFVAWLMCVDRWMARMHHILVAHGYGFVGSLYCDRGSYFFL